MYIYLSIYPYIYIHAYINISTSISIYIYLSIYHLFIYQKGYGRCKKLYKNDKVNENGRFSKKEKFLIFFSSEHRADVVIL